MRPSVITPRPDATRPLANRVDPFGDPRATTARGALMGNRGGRFHRDDRALGERRFVSRRWIACECAFRGRHRDVWGAGYTELFFLDEATALAAGHRPCFFCRREAANRFRASWAQGNQVAPPSAPAMDRMLHAERLDGKAKRRHPLPGKIGDLPDGAMIAVGDEAFAILHGKAFRWTPAGYRRATLPLQDAQLLTPPSTVRTLDAGYAPVLHPSLEISRRKSF